MCFRLLDFVTVFEIKDIQVRTRIHQNLAELFRNSAAVVVLQKVKFRAWKFSTIMLTNLPEGNYSHREVVKLVWDYFPNQNLQTINYKVVVLPLQRRVSRNQYYLVSLFLNVQFEPLCPLSGLCAF